MHRHGKSWHKVELIWLEKMAQRKLSWNEIADSLGRTVAACYARYTMIRFSEFYRFAATEEASMRSYFEGNPIHKEGL